MYALTDDAPFAVPTGCKAHYVITVTNAAAAMGTFTDITSAAALGVPSYTDKDGTKYPKAVCLAVMDATADVWATVDGQTPVIGTTQPVGVKLPPTYPTLRIPHPSAIKNNTIKLVSGAAGGTPVLVYFEW